MGCAARLRGDDKLGKKRAEPKGSASIKSTILETAVIEQMAEAAPWVPVCFIMFTFFAILANRLFHKG
ncbi:hypothetical protein [Fibrobacter sp. UWEL]|uniref:hypothetical protein n=1 Tax=Fibrobacter sp. UWEL TaxID=1896209 RepID=UPI0011606E93|nr:hypothetical protein [Fibrobacter sp. UWEL]